jgi:hypothetical protein
MMVQHTRHRGLGPSMARRQQPNKYSQHGSNSLPLGDPIEAAQHHLHTTHTQGSIGRQANKPPGAPAGRSPGSRLPLQANRPTPPLSGQQAGDLHSHPLEAAMLQQPPIQGTRRHPHHILC